MSSAQPDNANPVIHQSSSRRKARSHHLNLDDDDEYDHRAAFVSRPTYIPDDDEDDLWVSGENGTSEREEIDQDEIFGKQLLHLTSQSIPRPSRHRRASHRTKSIA